MGRRGTQVAREAADMVLEDDELSTMVAAVEQGRVIFENVRKFVVYLLSGNVGEILAVGVAATAGTPLPLLPLQILYINVINDVFPALALGAGRGTPEVMQEPPRDPQEPVITRRGLAVIGGYGVMIALTILGVFFLALYLFEMNYTEAVTVSLRSLSLDSCTSSTCAGPAAGSSSTRSRATRTCGPPSPSVWPCCWVRSTCLLLRRSSA